MGPLAFVALIPLLGSLQRATAKRGALLGLTFGLVYWGVLMYWLLPFGVIAWLPLVVSQSAYTALFGLVGISDYFDGYIARQTDNQVQYDYYKKYMAEHFADLQAAARPYDDLRHPGMPRATPSA